jgi:hypothetical protein
MEILRDLIIRGESEQLAALMDDVEKSLPPGWVRDRLIEGELRALSATAKPTYSFVHNRDDRFPAATIFFREQEPGLLTAANIAPLKRHRLSHRQYNTILEEFCERAIRPCAEKRGVPIELTTNQGDMSDWLSDAAAEKLRTFSTLSIQDIGCIRPEDRERWIDFIVTAHRYGSRLAPSTLRRWLVEIEGWSPGLADQLTAEYVFGGDILSFSERVGA